MKIGAAIPLAAALLVLSVSMVAAAYDGEQPAALGGCYWRATVKQQAKNYGKVQCSAFKSADCNTTVDPCSGYSCRAGPVEGWVKTQSGSNHTNTRDCGVHNEAWGAPKRLGITCGMGNDAAGVLCEVNDAKDGCKVTTGTCVFFAGTPYGEASSGHGYSAGVRMGVDACEDMMVGSCWGSDNKPRCVATKDQCQASETYRAWNYKCDGKFVCPGGCKQAQTTPKKPITKYGSCTGGTARCAIDATHCAATETFVKPYTTGAKDCPCNKVPTGVCQRIANPPKYKVKAIDSVRCVTTADACEAGGRDGYGRPQLALEKYLPATDAAAIAAKCFLCLDFNMDTATTAWPTQTCTDPFTTYFHPYLPHTHEIQMQVKLPVSKSAFDTDKMKGLFKVAVAGACGIAPTSSYDSKAVLIDVSDVYITKLSVASAEAVIVDVQIKTYSQGMADGMKSRMTLDSLKMHLAAAGRTCGTGKDGTSDAAETCAVNDALDACKVTTGTCAFVGGMLSATLMPAVEVCSAGNVVAWTAASAQLQAPSWAGACAVEIVVSKDTAFFVTITVTMPYTKAAFDAAKQETYKAAVASAAGTTAANVDIVSIVETRRRAGSIAVNTKIRASDAAGSQGQLLALGTGDALKNKINTQLKAKGLAESTGVSAPVMSAAVAAGAGGLRASVMHTVAVLLAGIVLVCY